MLALETAHVSECLAPDDEGTWLVEVGCPNSGVGFYCLTKDDAFEAKRIIDTLVPAGDVLDQLGVHL